MTRQDWQDLGWWIGATGAFGMTVLLLYMSIMTIVYWLFV